MASVDYFEPVTEKEVDYFEPVKAQPKTKPTQIPESTTTQDTFGRNLAASLTTDALGGLTMLGGLVGAAGETGYDYLTSPEEKTLKESWEESIGSGADRALLEGGTSIRNAGRDFLNAPHVPTTTAGQAGEILGMFGLPIPGAALTSLLGKTAGKALALTTPLVRIEGVSNRGVKPFLKSAISNPNIKGNLLRVGAQGGLATGISQGSRALLDEPLLFSEEALGTKDYFEPVVDFEVDERATIDRQMQDNEDSRNYAAVGVGTAIAVGTVVLGVAARRSFLKKSLPSTELPLGPAKTRTSKMFNVKGSLVDRTQFIRKVAQEAKNSDGEFTFTPAQVDGMVEQFSVDSISMTEEILKYGTFGDNISIPDMPSVRDWTLKYMSMTDETRDKLIYGIMAGSEQPRRIRSTLADIITKIREENPNDLRLKGDDGLEKLLDIGTPEDIQVYLRNIGIEPDQYVKPGLLDPDNLDAFGQPMPWSATKIQKSIDDMHNDPAAMKMAKDYGKMVDGMLEFAKKSKLISDTEKSLWRNRFTMYGRNMYMPGVNVAEQEKEFSAVMSKLFGVTSTEGRELDNIRNFQSSIAADNQGITNPLHMVQAFAQYTHSVVNHANNSTSQWALMSKMLGMEQDLNKLGQFIGDGKPIPNKYGIEFAGIRNYATDVDETGAVKSYASSLTDYVKKGDISSLLAQKLHIGDKSGKAPDLKNVISIQRDGKDVLFWIKDDLVFNAISNGPRQLGILNKIGRAFKNLFQGGTTRLPMFLPKSWMYSTQQTWSNAIAQGFSYTPWDAFKGTWELAAVSLADEASSHIMRSLARNSGIFAALPREMVKNWERAWAAKAKKSLMQRFQQEGGSLTSSAAVSDAAPNVMDLMNNVVPHMYKDNWLGIRQAARYYDRLNRAIHEGPAYAAKAKYINKLGDPTNISPADFRAAERFGKSLSGDVRRVGSAPAALAIQSWVPFSGAMIQSWNSIGTSLNIARKEGNYFKMAAAVSLPAIPAMSEALMFSLLGKEFLEWYWNGISTEDRNNNWWIPIDPTDPSKSLAIPVSPEWTLPKAMAIEGIDLLTGISKGLPHEQFGKGESSVLGENGWHFLAALVRVLDIPVPPAIKAMLAFNGINLRIGPQITDDGGLTGPVTVSPLTSGEKISNNRGSSRYTDPILESEGEAAIQAILGGIGTMLMGVSQAFVIGTSDDKTGNPIANGLSRAAETSKDEILKQAKYLNSPLFAKSLFTKSGNDELSDSARVKLEGVKTLSNMMSLAQNPGLNSSGAPLQGTPPPLTQDPVMHIAMMVLETYKESFTHHRSVINDIRKNNDSLRSTATMKDENGEYQQYSVAQVKEKTQENNNLIRAWNSMIILVARTMEQEVNSIIETPVSDPKNELPEQYKPFALGRNGDFKLNKIKPRGNLNLARGLKGLVSTAPPTN